MARGGKGGRPRLVIQNYSPNPIVIEQQGVESSTPSNSATPEARPSSPINGIVIQQASTAFASHVPLLSSYASMVDPDEGTDLKFMPTHSINGVRCAKVEEEDVATEIEYW